MGAIDPHREIGDRTSSKAFAIASIDAFSVWIAVRAGRLIRLGY